MESHGDSDAAEKFGGPDVVRWHNFFEARGSAGYRNPNPGIRKDEDEMDEILYGYGFSYVHLRVMAMFYPYPNWPLRRDAPFMLKLRQKMGADLIGLLEDVEGLCLHIVHSTAVRQIQRSLISWPRGAGWLAVSDSTAYSDLWTIIPRVCRGSQVFSPVCVTFSHAETTCEHAGRIIYFPPISDFTMVLVQFHHFHKMFSESGQENHWFEPRRKIPGIESEVAMFECL